MVALYIDRRNISLTANSHRLMIYSGEKLLTTLPFKLLKRVALYGDTALSASLLGKFGAHQIPLLVLQGWKREPALLTPTIPQDAAKRVMQASLGDDLNFCLRFSKKIIERKLIGQYRVVDHILSHRKERYIDRDIRISFKKIIDNAAQAESVPTLLGLEGAGARLYFKVWEEELPKGWGFKGRNRRPPKDPLNALLSLGYTLLYYEWVRILYFMGFDPYIGFYHQLKFGRASLAADLMEPFRPRLDAWLLSLMEQKRFRAEDFHQKGVACYISKEARLSFYEQYELWLRENAPLFSKYKGTLYLSLKELNPDLPSESFEVTRLCDLI